MKHVWLAERPLVVVVILGFLLWILIQVTQRVFWVLVLVLLAIILAAAMMPIVRFMRRMRFPLGWRLPSVVAVLLIYLASALILGALAYVIGGVLISEIVHLFQVLPDTAAEIVSSLGGLLLSVGVPSSIVPSSESIVAQVQGLTGRILEAAPLVGLFVQSVVGFFFQLFFVLTLALFLVIEADSILAFWVNLFPSSKHDQVRSVTIHVGHKFGMWLLGQVAVASITGVLAGIGAALLGLPYPVLIGVCTAALDLAPMAGPSLMVVPGFVAGLFQSPFIAIAAGLYFYTLAFVDANVLSPVVTGRAVRASPSLIITAVVLGLALYGAIGALIAVPVTAGLQVVAREVVLPWLYSRENEI